MKPQRTIATMPFGSHLYGTTTPDSDHDFKKIFLPSGRDIMLGRYRSAYEKNTATYSHKNTKTDTDVTFTSLSKFFSMVIGGDAMGLELLFIPPNLMIDSSPEFDKIVALRSKLINRKCEGFVGYCQRQAARYGIKASRFLTLQKALAFLDREIDNLGGNARLNDVADKARDFARANDHCEIAFIRHPSGVDHEFISVCDRKIAIGNSLANCREIIVAALKYYGERAKIAAKNTGHDWEALAHAVRVGQQAIELLSTGTITFPRPNAEELVAIKLGRVDYNSVSVMMNTLLEDVHHARDASILPETTDLAIVENLIVDLHLSQLN